MQQSDCWNYLGPFSLTKSGAYYGRYDGENAHRISYRSHIGEIPKGLTIDHLCRNTVCINPKHLEAVTLAENIRRGFSPTAINKRKTHCLRGHPFTIKRAHGQRGCLVCQRVYGRRSYHRRRHPAAYDAVQKGRGA